MAIVCAYCFKSFSSGKAYGGHKRIHHLDEQQEQIIRCSECPRFFKSRKSLFGHMRTHPERPWRGINPPQSDITAIEIRDARVLDLTDSLGGRSWLSYDRRGRKPKTRNNLADDDTNSAVNPRLMLDDKERHTNSSSASSEVASADNDEKKKKVEKVDDIVTVRQCVCSICNKSFPSYQALGGHMASHNKSTTKKMDRQEESCSSADHQCNICGVSFRTGQALGGHKKRHWWSPNSSSSGLKEPQLHRVRLEFDLNRLPSKRLD